MRNMKIWILILAAVCLAVTAAAAEEDYLGKPLADFSVETISGEIFTLSEALKEKELVIINLWATWCGPCAMEFPYMEEVYEEYQDRVEIIALSVDPGDTKESIAEYAADRGLTFPMGNDAGIGLSETFRVMYIPTTVMIDRDGIAVASEYGAKTSADAFRELFERYLEDEASGAE